MKNNLFSILLITTSLISLKTFMLNTKADIIKKIVKKNIFK